MLYGRYSFFNTFLDDAVLPYYKGSTFRGVFGHALKSVTCALKRQECSSCLLREKCVYAFVFEIRSNGESGSSDQAETLAPERRRIAAPPHPYVLEPPLDTRRSYLQGESFDFSLILFGQANDYLPYFVYALEEMGLLGIGRQSGNTRARFRLESVMADATVLYNRRERSLKSGNFAEDLVISDSTRSNELKPCESLELTLLTPLRLKYENRLEATLPFHILIRAALRRISSLFQYYGAGEPALDYRGLVERAQRVTVDQSSLHWFDWKRYSNRQDQSMLMGGLMGSIRYSGPLAEFLPLLRICEKTHLGKQTSFGLGKIILTGAKP
ncbi:CRISPR system precrRNA processing endoribonuclease RAMP protein Cas6 [Syntrophus gentianae]|nr:CRISPR system precrRNA processing endoribonuclease RAMP protein Cas6 [Syntrophus gentianae]